MAFAPHFAFAPHSAFAPQDPMTQQQMLGMMPMGMMGHDQLQVSCSARSSRHRLHGAVSKAQDPQQPAQVHRSAAASRPAFVGAAHVLSEMRQRQRLLCWCVLCSVSGVAAVRKVVCPLMPALCAAGLWHGPVRADDGAAGL